MTKFRCFSPKSQIGALQNILAVGEIAQRCVDKTPKSRLELCQQLDEFLGIGIGVHGENAWKGNGVTGTDDCIETSDVTIQPSEAKLANHRKKRYRFGEPSDIVAQLSKLIASIDRRYFRTLKYYLSIRIPDQLRLQLFAEVAVRLVANTENNPVRFDLAD
jgi:hypothetical protein